MHVFRICGGVGGDPHRPEIRVHSITAGSVASGLNLEEGDIVVHINHRKLDDVTVQAASKLLQKAYGLVAVGLTRKIASQRGSVASIQLDTLPFADDGTFQFCCRCDADAVHAVLQQLSVSLSPPLCARAAECTLPPYRSSFVPLRPLPNPKPQTL